MDLYLIDGNSYVYRAFYAIKGLTNSKGMPTNAIYGFTNMLLKIIKEKSPQALAISFDSAMPTERHMLFEQYKAHRPKAPDELIGQMPYIKKIITALNIKIFEMPGHEADDILATVAEKAVSAGMNVFIVTGDKDMLQLLTGSIKVYDPMKDAVLDESYVREKLGVPASRVTEFMALTGDAADNIPGIKGIGEKTARELLSEFESLDELIAHAHRIKKERLRRLITENIEVMKLSKRLAEINRDVPIEINIEDLLLREPDWQSLLSLFKEFEFFSLIRLIPAPNAVKKDCSAITSADGLNELLNSIKEKGEFSFYIEIGGREGAGPGGISICHEKGRALYIPFLHEAIKKEDVINAIRPVFEDRDIAKIGHNLKNDMLILKQEGILLQGMLYDIMVADHLLSPLKSDHGIDGLSLEHLSRKASENAGYSTSEAQDKACEAAELIFELKDLVFRKLKHEALDKAYFDIEMPLIYVLMEMEEAGVKIDTDMLNDLSKELEVVLDSLKNRIYFLSGEEFNINSPKQLARVLFDVLGLKPLRKKKTGYSTDVGVLEGLSKTHELPSEILNWRSLYKLKNTYVDALPVLVRPATGRLHTSFSQTITSTGRLSSKEPNLQNIPIRGEWANRIREAFVAEHGSVIISADYSQIELRILAHLAGDKQMAEAFLKDIDIHSETAAEIFNIVPQEVTEDMRRVAKTVNFGIVYGITPFGLSDALNISREDAEKYIRQYFQRHPSVRAYIEKTIKDASEKGYVETIFGRKRPVPELKSKNLSVRHLGERLAINSPVQGSAADIIKIAMINILKAGLCPVLQVHDELLFECPEEEKDRVIELVRAEMESAVRLSVPLKVEISSGKNWTFF